MSDKYHQATMSVSELKVVMNEFLKAKQNSEKLNFDYIKSIFDDLGVELVEVRGESVDASNVEYEGEDE